MNFGVFLLTPILKILFNGLSSTPKVIAIKEIWSLDFGYKKKGMKNYFKGFEPKRPKSLKNGQMSSVNEFLEDSIYFD